ncbi:unnamed protein product [Allacma fusca]|uniref:Uncharacterized protein n=1 Tax=Allacma fusca TaxID=39272 RepID=A0A8J2KXX9_9HEXA|nr:unnamed protein product [Allacma fusca]
MDIVELPDPPETTESFMVSASITLLESLPPSPLKLEAIQKPIPTTAKIATSPRIIFHFMSCNRVSRSITLSTFDFIMVTTS